MDFQVALFFACTVVRCLVTLPQDAASDSAELQVSSPSDPQENSLSVAEVTALVRKSLVQVRATARDGSDHGIGAGFVIDDSGLVVTARHVIGDGRDFVVDLPGGTTSKVIEVYASSSQLDVAVIRMEDKSLPPLRLGTPALITQGRDVVAMGHPRGFRDSVVSGVISGRRDIEGVSMIQLAMPIEPGNSGGPLVDRTGRVLGVVTMKSTETANLGFAIPVDFVTSLLDDPNPVPMDRWRTIGALDSRNWTVLFGANWRQHAGRISVNGMGSAFGGRTLCLSTKDVPAGEYEIRVRVRLEDERGAAGLVFHSDGNQQHYGFYPSAGNLRLTRFSGPDVESWTILHNAPHPAYKPDDWNVISVKIRQGGFTCFVNGERVVDSTDSAFESGRIGLASFRGTEADFRGFEFGSELPSLTPNDEAQQQLRAAVAEISASRPATHDTVERLGEVSRYATDFFEREARVLERRAEQLRRSAADVHQTLVRKAIQEELARENETEKKSDLLRLALLIARLDNQDVDVDAYLERVQQMADEVQVTFPENASVEQKLVCLDEYLFVSQGFRGSRFEYYTRSNSYLNEVIDDREGLPITLSVLYMALAERLKIPVSGIGLPGHFVVRFEAADPGSSVLIDPFERGKRISKEEAAERVLAAGAPNLPEFYEPQTVRQIVRRMMMNLLDLAEQERIDNDVLRYLEVLTEVDPDALEYRAKRLELRARTGRIAEALEDVDWFIKRQSTETDQDRLFELRAELQRQLDEQNKETAQFKEAQ